MSQPTQAKHIGVYGIALRDGALLVIKKNRGPYTGMFDLPGGSLEHGETIEAGLRREFLEEIGVEIQKADVLENVTHIARWDYDGVDTETFHIGMYYLVWLDPEAKVNMDADGHDSDGALWVDLAALREEEISPIAWKILKKTAMK